MVSVLKYPRVFICAAVVMLMTAMAIMRRIGVGSGEALRGVDLTSPVDA